MKRKIAFISIFIIVIAISIFTQKSYAAIQIKPSSIDTTGKTDAKILEEVKKEVLINTSVSNSYLLCLNMTKQGESLYGSTVLPHLSTNADWGAVSYLSNSIYGTNTQGQNTGVQIKINGMNYYSTTGNVTGVMNWGSNCYTSTLYTQTASIIQAYLNDSTSSTATSYVSEIEKAAKNNSRYVEIIDTSNFTVKNTLGMALAEVKGYPWGQYGYSSNNTSYPIAARQGLFGFDVGYSNDLYLNGAASGSGSEYATFRPVIWNK